MDDPVPLGPQPARTDRPRAAALRVLRALLRSGAAVTITDLTAQLGGHPNTVRLHLEQLISAGFVSESVAASSGPGRPARAYTATVAGRQVGMEDDDRGEHAALVEAVADELAARPDPVAAARALGLRWGQRLRHDGDTDPLTTTLARQGFTPTPHGDGLALLTCPLLEAVQRRPDVVCAMHQGMIDALAARPLVVHPFAVPGACLIQPLS